MQSGRLPLWLTYLEYERRHEPGTLAVYKTAANAFLKFLATDGKDYRVEKNKDVAEALRWFMRWCTLMRARPGREKADTSTLRTYLGALSSYYSWEVLENYRDKNPVSKVHKTKLEADHRELLNAEEIRAMFNACDQVEWPWNPPLARAIMALMAGNALRVAEVRSLPFTQLDLVARRIRIEDQKNDQVSHLPIADPFFSLYQEWIYERDRIFGSARRRRHGRKAPTTDRFLSFSPDWPIGEEGIYKLFRRLRGLARVEKEAFPHALRHFAITAYYEAGGLKDAQILARHKDEKTTSRYVHPDGKRLAQIAKAPGILIWEPGRDITPQLTLKF